MATLEFIEKIGIQFAAIAPMLGAGDRVAARDILAKTQV